MWQKCSKRASLAQRIMTFVNMQLCNSSLHIHGQRRGVLNYCQGRNEVKWCPGQDASLAPPYSNLRSFGSKCIVLKNVRVKLLGFFGVRAINRRPRTISVPPLWIGARVIAPPCPSLRPCWLNHNVACKKLQMFTLANNLPLCDKNALNVLD